MQFQEKCMIQTQANWEKPNFGPDLGLSIFFSKIWHQQPLDIIVSYHQV